MITPRIVSVHGVKTPPKVPNPSGRLSFFWRLDGKPPVRSESAFLAFEFIAQKEIADFEQIN
jgi:hypothetical protein